MQRRDFFSHAGLIFGAPVLGISVGRAALATERPAEPRAKLDTWKSVRELFTLDPDFVQMSGFFLAPHPAPVRAAIEKHRRGLDANPIGYVKANRMELELRVHRAAARYMNVDSSCIALTDSTTMGLGLVYGLFHLEPDQEILTTDQEHFATWKSLELRTKRTGATLKHMKLYENPATASVAETVNVLEKSITPRTRLVAVTWVHSSTGVKLPIRAMADVIARANRTRDERNRIVLCVDGVHGFGAADETVADLHCDIFIAGTHKWIFGPRGTGVVYANAFAQSLLSPIIPPFRPFPGMSQEEQDQRATWGIDYSPGGFHSFEHRWAVPEAFELHEQLGRARVAQRIHDLNRQLKQALLEMPHVTVHTPIADELSAGLTTFEIKGLTTKQTVARLHELRIISSESPYKVSLPRLAPTIFNDEAEVEQTIKAVHALRS